MSSVVFYNVLLFWHCFIYVSRSSPSVGHFKKPPTDVAATTLGEMADMGSTVPLVGSTGYTSSSIDNEGAIKKLVRVPGEILYNLLPSAGIAVGLNNILPSTASISFNSNNGGTLRSYDASHGGLVGRVVDPILNVFPNAGVLRPSLPIRLPLVEGGQIVILPHQETGLLRGKVQPKPEMEATLTAVESDSSVPQQTSNKLNFFVTTTTEVHQLNHSSEDDSGATTFCSETHTNNSSSPCSSSHRKKENTSIQGDFPSGSEDLTLSALDTSNCKKDDGNVYCSGKDKTENNDDSIKIPDTSTEDEKETQSQDQNSSYAIYSFHIINSSH